MATVCSGPEFTTDGGMVVPAVAGSFRMVAKLYKAAVNDGSFGSLPLPGRVHIEAELTWTNNTGMPQIVMIEAERGPWYIQVSNPNQAGFRDRLTAASGVNARADDPAISSVFDGDYASFYYAPAPFFWASPDSATTTMTQDRSRFQCPAIFTANAGDTVSARYRCALFTATWKNITGPPQYDARARYVFLRMWAAPGRTS